MKLISKEEERLHYNATLLGGFVGGLLGLGLGTFGILGASYRYPIVRHLTIPMKVFLATSAGTFGAIIRADQSSRAFEYSRRPEDHYKDVAERQRKQIQAQQPISERVKDWARENRYAAIGGSWIASMVIAMSIVGRSPQSTTQKLVQARVYAQGLTLLVLLATAALEIGDRNQGEGRWETVKIIDPSDPEHKRVIERRIHQERYAGEDQWKDMVAAEEKKMQGKQTHSAHGRRDGKKGSQNGQHERKERDDQGHRQESDSAKGARKPDATNSH